MKKLTYDWSGWDLTDNPLAVGTSQEIADFVAREVLSEIDCVLNSYDDYGITFRVGDDDVGASKTYHLDDLVKAEIPKILGNVSKHSEDYEAETVAHLNWLRSKFQECVDIIDENIISVKRPRN